MSMRCFDLGHSNAHSLAQCLTLMLVTSYSRLTSAATAPSSRFPRASWSFLLPHPLSLSSFLPIPSCSAPLLLAPFSWTAQGCGSSINGIAPCAHRTNAIPASSCPSRQSLPCVWRFLPLSVRVSMRARGAVCMRVSVSCVLILKEGLCCVE